MTQPPLGIVVDLLRAAGAENDHAQRIIVLGAVERTPSNRSRIGRPTA